MHSSDERKAANEAAFREVNEQMIDLQEQWATDHDQLLTLVCECDRLDCAERLLVTPGTYEHVRADGACFLVLPGHEDLLVEEIVETGGGYLVVRKRVGEPRDVALETDPRS